MTLDHLAPLIALAVGFLGTLAVALLGYWLTRGW